MQRMHGVVQSKGGRVVVGALIQVFLTGTNTPVTIYSDRAGTQEITQLLTDNEGEWAFYAANGRVDILTVINGRVDGQLIDVLLHDPADVPDEGIDPAVLEEINGIKSDITTLEGGQSNLSAQVQEVDIKTKDFDNAHGTEVVKGNWADGRVAAVAELADANGSAMIGHGDTTLGAVVTANTQAIAQAATDLAASTGSSKIGHIAVGTGAVARTAQDKLRDVVSVKDFGAKGDGVTDDTAAFIAAIAASNTVFMPPGTYLVGSIPINKNNFMLRGAGSNQSILLAKNAADITLDVARDNSVSFLTLEDFKLQGNATALGGIRLGSSATNYCAVPVLNRVSVWDYNKSTGGNGFGIQLACVQNVTIHNCWIYRNRHNYQRLQSTGYATSIHITGKSGYIGEGYIGMYVDAQIDDLYVDDVVIEGNSNSGIIITAAAVLGGRGTSLYMNGVYVEANNATGAGVIHVTGGAGAYQEHLVILERLNFAANTGKFLVVDKTYATVRGTRLLPSDITTTASTTTCFEHNRFPSAADYLTQYRALLGNVIVRDTNTPATATDLNQVNLVTAVTFPATKRPVSDRHTLDCYEEGVSGEFVPVAVSFGGTITSMTGRYVKIGMLVRFSVVMVGTNIASTWTTSTISLPFPVAAIDSAHMFNGATGQSLGNAYIDAGSDKILPPTWAAIPDATIVFSGSYFAEQ